MNQAAHAVLQRCREQWLAARADRDRDVAYVIETKTRLAPDYWEREYRARERLRVAKALAEELSQAG